MTNALFPMAMALAEELAAAGAGLVLVARDAEGLAALAEGLQRRYGTSVTVMAADLSQPETPRMIFDAAWAQSPLDLLIHHADHDSAAGIVDLDWAQHEATLQRHVTAPCALTHCFSAALGAHGWGRVLFVTVASAARRAPAGEPIAYASQAFLRHYAAALRARWRGSGRGCTLLCVPAAGPWVSSTSVAPLEPVDTIPALATTRLARRAVRALLAGSACVTPGRLNGLWQTTLSLMSGGMRRWRAKRSRART